MISYVTDHDVSLAIDHMAAPDIDHPITPSADHEYCPQDTVIISVSTIHFVLAAFQSARAICSVCLIEIRKTHGTH